MQTTDLWPCRRKQEGYAGDRSLAMSSRAGKRLLILAIYKALFLILHYFFYYSEIRYFSPILCVCILTMPMYFLVNS